MSSPDTSNIGSNSAAVSSSAPSNILLRDLIPPRRRSRPNNQVNRSNSNEARTSENSQFMLQRNPWMGIVSTVRLQINSITCYRYNPKKILVEEILWLAHLTPAPLQVEVTMVSQARINQRVRAAQARAAAQLAQPSTGSTQPTPAASSTPEANLPLGPITIEIRARSQSGEEELHSEEARLEEERNMDVLRGVTECWRTARLDLRSPDHPIARLEGDKWIPDW
ncbi:UNVERIFIED_CONTAM: hypothetical protein Sindi_2304500 [Sesamum indicum]